MEMMYKYPALKVGLFLFETNAINVLVLGARVHTVITYQFFVPTSKFVP